MEIDQDRDFSSCRNLRWLSSRCRSVARQPARRQRSNPRPGRIPGRETVHTHPLQRRAFPRWQGSPAGCRAIVAYRGPGSPSSSRSTAGGRRHPEYRGRPVDLHLFPPRRDERVPVKKSESTGKSTFRHFPAGPENGSGWRGRYRCGAFATSSRSRNHHTARRPLNTRRPPRARRRATEARPSGRDRILAAHIFRPRLQRLDSQSKPFPSCRSATECCPGSGNNRSRKKNGGTQTGPQLSSADCRRHRTPSRQTCRHRNHQRGATAAKFRRDSSAPPRPFARRTSLSACYYRTPPRLLCR